MEESISLTFSNRIELLAEELKAFLFAYRRSAFEKIVVVVPSPAMKSWLMHWLAEDSEVQIAFGFQILYPHEAIRWLQRHVSKKRGEEVPDLLELALLIDQALPTIHDHPFQKLFQERPREKAEISLKLAKLFLTYGEYGSGDYEGWQGELWQKIYGNRWVPLHCYLEELEMEEPPFPMQLHLFGIGYLSEVKQRFFQRIAEKVPLQTWILSPSRLLWSDLRSAKEQQIALKRHMVFDEGNALIANNGRLGRAWMQQLEELPCETLERYQISSSAQEHPAYHELMLDGIEIKATQSLSLLQAIQADLTLLRPSQEPLILDGNDRSIEIHNAPSILRELEALYQTLLRAIQEHQMTPQDILVLIPDMEQYAPFIRTVFEGPESCLKAEIVDSSAPLTEGYIRTFLYFLDLAQSRWDFEQLIFLLEQPCFRKKSALSLEELQEIKGLLSRAGVHWGLSQTHREEFLQGSLLEKSDQGTWEGAFTTLCRSLAEVGGSTSFTQVDALEKLLLLLNALKADLLPLLHESTYTLQKWALQLTHLLDKYFEPLTKEEDEGELKLRRFLQYIAHCEAKVGFSGPLSFQALRIYMQEELQHPESSYRQQHLQAVRFCSLLPMRLVPARLVALIGLNNFPRYELNNSLNQLKGKYVPTATDYDRYSFLESLLSVRDKWILSYVSSTGDESCLIQELLQYLDERYLLGDKKPSEKLQFTHPAFAFDPFYFTPDSPAPSYSARDFRSACCFLHGPDLPQKQNFQPPLEQLDFTQLPTHLTLTQLKNFLYHPIKHYLNHALGLYLSSTENRHETMEEFEKNYWPSQLLTEALTSPLEHVIDKVEKKGLLPVEPFKAAAKIRLKEELQEMLQGLSLMGIEPFEVEFSHGCTTFKQLSARSWQAPAVELELGPKKFTITGVLPLVSAEGMVSFREQAALVHLPELLLHHSLPDTLSKKMVHFPKKGKSWKCKATSASLLKNFARSFHQPLPLYSNWIAPLLAEDAQQLLKAMQLSLKPAFYQSEDPYMHWMLRKPTLEEANSLIHLWKAEVEQLVNAVTWEEA